MSYVRPEILYGSEDWCLKEGEMGILQMTERSMMRAMCGVQLKDRKIIISHGVFCMLKIVMLGHNIMHCTVCTILNTMYCSVCTILNIMYCAVYTILHIVYCTVCTILNAMYCTVCTILNTMYCAVCTILNIVYSIVCTILDIMYCMHNT